jgi:hypothetical protein
MALKVALRVAPMALGILFAGAAFAECVPTKPVKIVTVNATPGLAADDFRRKPKVFYRLGNGKTRLEEQADPAQGIHALYIIDAPDFWVVNLSNKTGIVGRDTDTPSIVYASVFEDPALPAAIRSLEFGCEQQFIAHPDTTQENRETASGTVIKHSVVSGKWKATLGTREGSDKPDLAILSEHGKVVLAIRYVSYEWLDTLSQELFEPPAGFTFEKARPGE